MQQVLPIQQEIGLTDDDVIVIMFTSLDQDYFTNLLISAGQFTEWFNINFEGETQEEVDFKNNQEVEWTAVIDQANTIITGYNKLVEEGIPKKMDEILT